jgi:hypothetical protein
MDQPHTQRAPAGSPARYTALKLDREAYRSFFDGENLTLAQQDELLESVWGVVVGIIDLHFDPSGKLVLAADSSAVVSFLNSENEKENDAAESTLAAGEDDS